MKILLFGGFLGSGKTTIIRAFIDGIIKEGLGDIAIIENEIGEVGVDDIILRDGSVQMTPLFGGCVCCEITGSLIGAVEEIYDQITPDWLIIELTGVAELANVKEVLLDYTTVDIEIAAIAVVDGSRWSRLQIIGDFIHDQIMDSDLIILNKADICTDDTDLIADGLEELTGVHEILLMSADRDRIADSVGVLKTLFDLHAYEHGHDEHSRHDDHDEDDDHDHEHGDHEDHDHDEHDHEHDMVGAYSVSIAIPPQTPEGKAALMKQISALFTEIGDKLSRDEIIYGHVKGVLMESETSFVRFSLTHAGEPDLLLSDEWDAAKGLSEKASLTLNMNSMLHTEHEIKELVSAYLDRFSSLYV